MSRFTILLVSSFAFVVSASAKDACPTSQLQKGIHIPPPVHFASSISQDNQAATIIFDDAYVALNAVRGSSVGTAEQTNADSKVFTLHIPYTTKLRSVKMTMDVRGFVDTDTAAAARLVACVGDATQIIDLGSDDKVKLKGKSKSRLSTEDQADDGDFQDRVTFTLQKHAAKPVCQVTLFLQVDRDTDTEHQGGALLVVDSLDFEIAKGGKAKYRK